MTHYLDANATEPLRPEARAAMFAALDGVGNPSSVHAAGRAARRIVEDAREVLAMRFGVRAGLALSSVLLLPLLAIFGQNATRLPSPQTLVSSANIPHEEQL